MNSVSSKWSNITLSLAAIFQAAKLVKDVARTGQVDPLALEISMNSILKIDAQSVLDIYGGAQNLQIGLQEIPRLLTKKAKKEDTEIIRYVISLMYLEKKFSKMPALKKTLTRRIAQAQSQAAHFSAQDPHVIETLASAFLQTLGQFRYRIQIVGNVNYLKQTEVVAKIRALLLAGIRATVLWRQMGGNKWQLFLWRKKIIATAKQLQTQT
ncbi:MAG: high frequency lysogenization protein HflD [Gammaproteobacteria bacterium]|nr:high frequency lysogenization protein HflD [Gammaproteobacteria bacterium]